MQTHLTASPQQKILLVHCIILNITALFAVGVSAFLSSRTTSTTESLVTLICLMEDYARPDEQFQWFRGDTLISGALSERYTVAYLDGFLTAQIGEAALSPARFTLLMISQPAVSDAGVYSCEVNGTMQAASVLLTVINPNGKNAKEDPQNYKEEADWYC